MALIKRSNIEKVKSVKVYTSYKKKDVMNGDIVKLRNGDIGVVIFSDNDNLKYYIRSENINEKTDKNFFLVFPDNIISFTFLKDTSLSDNLKCESFPQFDVFGVVPHVISDTQLSDNKYVYDFLNKEAEKYFNV